MSQTKKIMELPKKTKALLITLIVAVVLLTIAGCTTKYDFGRASRDEATAESAATVETETAVPVSSIQHPVDPSWFDDTAIVGDSVTVMLQYYCDSDTENPPLGKAMFYCSASLGYGNAQWDLYDENAVHPLYKGENHLVEDVIPVTGAKKVIITLGMNDLSNGVDYAFEQAQALFEKIKKNGPDAIIYIESTTPMLNSFQREVLNNENIRLFNSKLKEYADSMGDDYRFLDFYSVIADENGDLPLEYCSDADYMGIHFTVEACEKWVDFLRNNV